MTSTSKQIEVPETLSVYIHWPFCLAKCPYCDFNSHVRENVDSTLWQKALLTELDYFIAKTGKRKIVSVFFGGGTPSLMPPATVQALLEKLSPDSACEITLEANPTSVEAGRLKDFKNAGVNRVSMGVQSLNDEHLKFLGRKHSAKEALAAVKTASEIFERFSFDLIYARPEQSLKEWEAELRAAIPFAGDHMSLYQLTIEPNTNFYHLFKSGKLKLPDEETLADLYELTGEIMDAHNMPAYEVSNYAKIGRECQHNLAYWQYDDYIGIGPGAHGRFTADYKKHESQTIKSPEKWIESVTETGNGTSNLNTLDNLMVAEECLLMGLRIKQGVSIESFRKKTGHELSEIINPQKLEEMRAMGFLEFAADNLSATKSGIMVLDKVISELLG